MDYQVIKELGKGSFGTVELVRKRDGLLYALKTIKIIQDYPIERAYAEISALEILKPHCRDYFLCYDMFDLRNPLEAKIFTQFVPNTMALDAYISENPKLGILPLLFIMRDLAIGLGLMHSQNVVHRDVKPADILFMPKHALRCKYVDYGSACVKTSTYLDAISSGTLAQPRIGFTSEQKIPIDPLELKKQEEEYRDCAGKIIGTPIYMAPEIIRQNVHTFEGLFAADVWSLGIMFYELAYNAIPYKSLDIYPLLEEVAMTNDIQIPPLDADLKYVNVFNPIIYNCCRVEVRRRIKPDKLVEMIDMYIDMTIQTSDPLNIRKKLSLELPLSKQTPYMTKPKNDMFRTIQIIGETTLSSSSLDQLEELRSQYSEVRMNRRRKFLNPPPPPRGLSPWSPFQK